ncbi:facilitated trehalose transporter Tret1-like [Leptopilina heterotoma]|uniref:facilitated trehalose transporter Tret1-like n=1 Tax=Leptopilina heterotoma TaxID=63436 RepID=UPI001CA8EB7B|nr:facilitated trehalose transporter Tret1-like [Leptopilina heterotoma]
MKSESNDILKMENSAEKGSRSLQYACALSASLIVMECGVSLAWTSPSLLHLKKKDSGIYITEITGALLVSIYFLGCLIGCCFNPIIMEKFGRKKSFLLYSIPVIIGWIVITAANNYYVLCTGRFIVGLGDGGLLEFISIYLGEITEKDIRGKLSIITKSSMLVGVFYINAVGTYFSFRISNLISLFIPILFFVTFIFMPESPYIHLIQEREKDAIMCLMKLRGFKQPESVLTDFNEMKKAVMEREKCKRNSLRELICNKSNRKRLFILLMAKVTRNLSGSVAILTYLHEITMQSGNSNSVVLYICLVKIISSIVSSQLIDRVGRKIIFLTCGILCTLALATLGSFFFVKLFLNYGTLDLAWIPILSLVSYEIGYYMGLSPVGYVLQGELFPLKVKGMAVAIASIVEQFLSFGIGFVFPIVNYYFGMYVSFWIFSVCCFIGTLLVYFNTPETNNKTLEEVEALIMPKSKKVVLKPLITSRST